MVTKQTLDGNLACSRKAMAGNHSLAALGQAGEKINAV